MISLTIIFCKFVLQIMFYYSACILLLIRNEKLEGKGWVWQYGEDRLGGFHPSPQGREEIPIVHRRSEKGF